MADINIGPTKAEDSPHFSGDQGVMALGVRNDAGAALAADGDYIPLSTDSTGALRTTSTGGSSGTEYDEGTQHVNGDKVTMAGVVQQAADAALSANGDRSVLQVDANGFLKVNVKSGGSAVDLGKIEDSQHASGDVGVMMLGVQNVSGLSLADADGDYTPISVDGTGAILTSEIDGDGVFEDNSIVIASGTDTRTGLIGGLVLTAPISLVTNRIGAARITPQRAFHTNLRNEAGTEVGTAADPLRVDPTGTTTQPVSIVGSGGSTQYAEDTPHVPGADLLTLAGVIQQSADAALSGDGDRSLLQVDATGFAKVNVKTSALPTGAATAANQTTEIASLQELDNIVHASGTLEALNEFAAVGGQLDDVGTVTPTEGQAAAARITAARSWHVNLRAAAGTEVGTSGAPLRTDPTGSTTQPVSGTVAVSSITTSVTPGTGATNLGKAEDSAHSSTDVGVMALAVRQDVAAALAGTTGDYIPLTTHADGSLRAANNADQATSIRKTLDWSGAITGSTLWDPAAGLRFVLTDLVLSCSGASIVTIFEDTDTTANRVAKVSIAANGGFTMNYTKPIPGAADNILKVTVTGAGAVGFITVSGYEV